jgi:hypothetical protein
VVLTIGSNDELGQVVISASDGRRQVLGTYEDALALARHWRD